MMKRSCLKRGAVIRWSGVVALLSFTVGCGWSPNPVDREEIRQESALVGLRLISEDAAAVPPKFRGQALPCTVDPDHPNPHSDPTRPATSSSRRRAANEVTSTRSFAR